MDEVVVRKELDACLIPANRFTPDNWTGLADPFPSWAVA